MSDPLHNIEFIDEQEREYFAQAQLAEQTRAFLLSPVGRYLHGRAKQELEELKEKLLELDPYDPEGRKEMAQLQRDAYGARNFIRWCTELINEGDAAAAQLETYREE